MLCAGLLTPGFKPGKPLNFGGYMLKNILVGLTLIAGLSGQPLAAQRYDDARAVAKRIGELSKFYPEASACSGTTLAKSNFEDFKYNVGQFFGNEAASIAQSTYDNAVKMMDEMPPSEKRQIRFDLECDAKEQSTANELKSLFEDLAWYAEKSAKQN